MTNRELIEQLRQAGVDAAEWREPDNGRVIHHDPPLIATQAESDDGMQSDEFKITHVADFAPRTEPERITRMGEVMGEGIRQAFKDAGHSILKMVEEAEKEIAQARSDAKEICRDADAAGTEHAEHFEGILGHARAIAEMAAAVRAKLRGQRSEG